MIIDVEMISKVGLVRNINQDASFVDSDGENGIFVVSDGMGGHSKGEVASSMIVSDISTWWKHVLSRINEYELAELGVQCRKIIQDCNYKLYQSFSKEKICGGATVCVLIICGEEFAVLHAGDSRIYRMLDNKMIPITQDDVWENLPEVREQFSLSQLSLDKKFGKLTMAVGVSETVDIKLKVEALNKEDKFLLCSDGIYKHLEEQEISTCMKKTVLEKSAKKMLADIEKKVLKKGASDNYTAIICRTIRK